MNRVRSLLPWLLALSLLFVVYRSVPLRETAAAIRAIGIGEWLVLFGLNGAILLLLNGRWWLILRGLKQRVPFWVLFGYRLAGFGVSYFTPGPHFGGEPVQVLLLERRIGVSREKAVASVALDKLLELLVNVGFLVGGALLLLHTGLFDGKGWRAVILGAALLLVPAGLFGGILVGKRPFSTALRWLHAWIPYSRARRFLQSVRAGVANSEQEMIRSCRGAPGLMLAAFLITLLTWAGIIVEYGLALSFLGLSLTVYQVLLLLIAARVAILLPLPAGLGTLESSQVLGLGLLGLEPALGVSITLMIRARDVLLGAVGILFAAKRL